MEVISTYESYHGREKEVEAFFETKTGVQGLVEAGVTRIPKFFIHPPLKEPKPLPNASSETPVINLEGIGGSQRAQIISEIRNAAENMGFFQIVNHGFPVEVMEEMLASVKRFHEQPQEERKKWYTHDRSLPFRYFSNGNLHLNKGQGLWVDTHAVEFPDGKQDPMVIPEICREAACEYAKHMVKLRDLLSELLSEALGLPSDYISNIECFKTVWFACHYYPPCPEPDRTLGAPRHTDPPFLAVLLQDEVGGLQFFSQGQWVDVPPIRGAFVINIADLLQLISNDRFKAGEHRVLLRGAKLRLSVATLLAPSSTAMTSKRYGPIEELLSGKPPLYKETTLSEYTTHWIESVHGSKLLSAFKLA